MRIESVTAVAFGPFLGATLDLSPRLTVVYGLNEAGKSSWHAAIYASLCGMRRGKGQSAKDREFAELRRPWTGRDWEVHAVIRLDNGRRIELRQNLADPAYSTAVDADLGRDVTGEILNEGTPDAARWLGLDRQSFLSVACVRQAEVQGISERAGSLQDELQRAAASAPRDSTASEAIARLVNFQSEHAGLDRKNSTRPLRRAKDRVESAEQALDEARKDHAEWLALESEARDKRKKTEEQSRNVRMLRAQLARQEAESWRRKLQRARALAQAYPQGPPAPLSGDEALAQDVAAALESWQTRPAIPSLTGKSSAAIRAEIEALPSTPSGDLAPRPEAVAAMKAYERATQALELHHAQEPSHPDAADAKGLTADQLRELARTLETPTPPIDAGGGVKKIPSSRLSRPLIVGFAAAAVFGGAAVWASWNRSIGAALVLAGIMAFVWLVFRSGAKEALVRSQIKAGEEARENVNRARAQVIAAGLPADGNALRKIAEELVRAELQLQAREEWSRKHQELADEATSAGNTLAQALRRAGIVEITDLSAAFGEYQRACQSRAEQAVLAARREPLDQQLSDREAAESAADAAETHRTGAERKIQTVLAACGLDAPDPETATEKLRRWQNQRKARLIQFDEAAREYAELNALLSGATLEELETRTSDLDRRAAELAAEFGLLPQTVAAGLEEELQKAGAAERRAEIEAEKAEILARDRAGSIPGVSEAEEALASAEGELERVTRLNRTLTLTVDFLRKAEERVHRDIAPLLAAGVRHWLPGVTQNRYRDARVDPRDLSVQVLGPDNEWRDARHLSHGTAEQIYLLLRAVLAARLATTGETCPLILDDVLVQSDAARKRALLDVIVSLSRERQVILFTQEEDVLRWARANVVAPDRVVVLLSPLQS